MTVSATLKSLSARSLGEVQVPVPPPRDLDTVARLVEAAEAAYGSAVEAARLRRETLRDSVIIEIGRMDRTSNLEERPMTLTRQELESKLWQAADILPRTDRCRRLQELHLLHSLP